MFCLHRRLLFGCFVDIFCCVRAFSSVRAFAHACVCVCLCVRVHVRLSVPLYICSLKLIVGVFNGCMRVAPLSLQVLLQYREGPGRLHLLPPVY